jgi:hypothetical protein
MMQRRKGIGALLAGAALACAAIVAAAAPSARSTATAASCYPAAYVPFPINHIASGAGHVSCDSGAPSYQYTIKLVNRAGNVLTQLSSGPVSGGRDVYTDGVVCTGAYTHSFLYINVGGVGKSDTSGEAPLC